MTHSHFESSTKAAEQPEPAAVTTGGASGKATTPAVVPRRDVATLIGAALGALSLGACARESGADAREEKLGTAAAALSGSNFLWVDTIVATGSTNLRGLIGSDTSATSQPVVVVGGYGAVGDGGGGVFYWDTSSSTGDNGGTIIVPTGSTTGRWQRIYSDAVNVKWFGAKGDGTVNDAPAINAAVNFVEKNTALNASLAATGNTVYLPPGQYRVDAPSSTGAAIVISNNNATLLGAGGPPYGGTLIIVNGYGASGAGTGILIEAHSTVSTPAPGIAATSQLRNLSICGGTPTPQDLVVVHAEQVTIADCWFAQATRYGVLIESGLAQNFVGVTQAPAGTNLLCDFWRAHNLQFQQIGPGLGSAPTGNLSDGAALYVKGYDSSAGLATGCQAGPCNVSFADWSLAGGTWIGCYSQNGLPKGTGYSSGPNHSCWLGCGSEDAVAANFASGWGGLVAGAALGQQLGAAAPPWRIGSASTSLDFGSIGPDGAAYNVQLPGSINSGIDITRGFPAWQATTPYAVGMGVVPPTAQFNGSYYVCTTAGVSGAAVPSFPPSGTVSDGTVVWTQSGPVASASVGWSFTYQGARTSAYPPFEQFGWRWSHNKNGGPDVTNVDAFSGVFGWTDLGNPRGTGLLFFGHPILNSTRRWTLKQPKDAYGVPITLVPGSNVIYMYGKSAPGDNVHGATVDLGAAISDPGYGFWPLAMPRVSVEIEFPDVATLSGADLRVVGYTVVPEYNAQQQLLGYNFATKIVNGGANAVAVTLVWHFELFVQGYDSANGLGSGGVG